MADTEKQAPAPVRVPTQDPSVPVKGPRQVQVVDERGRELGFSIDVEGTPVQGEGTAELARRVKGWSGLVLDGGQYPYSEYNALSLLNRFPWIADQLRGAALEAAENET